MYICFVFNNHHALSCDQMMCQTRQGVILIILFYYVGPTIIHNHAVHDWQN